MLEFIPSYFFTNLSLFSFLIALVTGSLVGYIVYRRTTPPISASRRTFLGILRGLAVCGVILLIFAPEITFVWYQERLKTIIFAIDKSGSMSIVESNKSRIRRALDVFESVYPHLDGKANLKYYEFNTNAHEVDLPFSDSTSGGTDIAKSLQKMYAQNKPVDSFILMSDGNYTSGQDPLYTDMLDYTQLFTIGLGDTIDKPDLIITNVRANQLVYENKPTQIQVDLMMTGMQSSTGTVTIKTNGKVIDAKNVRFETPGSIISPVFEIIPRKTGTLKYVFEVTPLEEEEIIENNRFTKTIDVLKGKITIGIIAAQLDFDFKFFGLLLNEKEEFEVLTAVIPLAPNTVIAELRSVLERSDVLFLYNIPSDQRTLELLAAPAQKNIPAFLVINKPLNNNQFSLVQKYFPLQKIFPAGEFFDSQVARTIQGKFSAQLNIYPNETQNIAFWEQCPPLQLNHNQVEYGPGVTVYLESINRNQQSDQPVPVLMGYNYRGKKSYLMLGKSFWRWHFALIDDEEFNQGWFNILGNMTRWLITGSRDQNVILSTSANSFQLGQNIALNIEVYDGSLNPVEGALVRSKISGPGGSFEIAAEASGPGTYTESFSPLVEGTYKVEATAWLNDVELGVDNKTIEVIPVNKEFLHTRQNSQFLAELAARGGGKYYSESNADNIREDLDLSSKQEQISKSYELWYQFSIFLIIIFLFSLEWFLRKRSGLA